MKATTRIGLELGLALVLLAGGEARAANLWDGGGADDNWGTAANWDNDLVPTFPQVLTFAGMTRLTPTNETPRTVSGLDFRGDAGAFMIGGSPITLGGTLNNNSTTVQTINNDLTLSATRIVTSVFGASTVLGGNIGQSAAAGLTKNGAGTVSLKGDNSFTGTVTLNGAGGITQIGHNNALGTGTAVTLTAGTLQPVDGDRTLAATKVITVTDHIVSGAQNLTFNGKVTGAGASLNTRSLESSLDAGKVLTLAGGLEVAAEAGTEFMFLAGRGDTTIGAIANGLATTGRMRFRNAGTTTLTGVNTYNGYTALGGGGTVVLDYAAGNGSKFNDTAGAEGVLNLGYDGSALATRAGTDLVLKGGSHTEVVASVFGLGVGSQTNVRRDGGSSVLQMNAISIGNSLGSINFAENEIATTDTPNMNGILASTTLYGVPLTVGGTDWAYNHGGTPSGGNHPGAADSPVRAYANYTAWETTASAPNDTKNYSLTGNSTLTGSLRPFTIKLTNDDANNSLTLGNFNLFNSGAGRGLLYAGTAGQTYTITDGGGTGEIFGSDAHFFLVYANAGELIFDVAVNRTTTEGRLNKAGQGRVTLNKASWLKWETNVSEGALRLRHSHAVNVPILVNASVFGSVLELNKDTSNAAISTPVAATLAILGSGIAHGGALRNIAGDNTFGGAITIGSHGSGRGIGARINSDADTLTITAGITAGTVDHPGRDVTIGGAGNITVSTTKITGPGAVNKDGTGTLTLSAANDYTGNTTVNGGTLTVTGSLASGSKVMVNDGGTLSGSGTCNGPVWVESNGMVGATGGNLTVGDLALQSGSKLAVDGVNRVVVANPGAVTTTAGLTILPGAQVQLTGSLPAGTYTILDYSGVLKGAATNLTVANPAVGASYTFDSTAAAVRLTVQSGGTVILLR